MHIPDTTPVHTVNSHAEVSRNTGFSGEMSPPSLERPSKLRAGWLVRPQDPREIKAVRRLMQTNRANPVHKSGGGGFAMAVPGRIGWRLINES